MKKIYVASSWRNPAQPQIVAMLRAAGHAVYDFRNPKEGDHGFSWKDVVLDRDERGYCTASDLQHALSHPRAVEGFHSDYDAMRWAEVGILLLPCGRSAHLEAGWMAGAGRTVLVLAPPSGEAIEPELMYGLLGRLCLTVDEVISYLK